MGWRWFFLVFLINAPFRAIIFAVIALFAAITVLSFIHEDPNERKPYSAEPYFQLQLIGWLATGAAVSTAPFAHL